MANALILATQSMVGGGDLVERYPYYTRPVSVADALSMKVTKLPVDPQVIPLETAHLPRAVFSPRSESRSHSTSPIDSLQSGSKDDSPRSILCTDFTKNMAKKKKNVQWAPTAEQMIFKAEQSYEDFSHNSSEYEEERSVAKTRSVNDDRSVVAPVNSFKKNIRSTNCSYSDYIDGQILVASEESKEKKDAFPLERLSEFFASLLYAMDSDDTNEPILNEALDTIAGQLQQFSGECNVQVPVCGVASTSFSVASLPGSPTFNGPVFRTVLIQEPQPVMPAQKAKQESLIGGDAFDMMFAEALEKRDKGLLETLKGFLDPETQEYRAVEDALHSLN
jgi:hypothetical protein